MTTLSTTPLRQRMIEDMTARKLSSGTQKCHVRSCKRFAAFLERSPNTASPEDIRRFQLHLSESAMSIGNRNRAMTGLKFLFRVTLRRPDLAAAIYHIREPQKIPLVISPHEAKRRLAMAKTLKVRLLLSLAYGCGLRAGEVVRLRAGDIDSAQRIIRVVQAKGRKDRNVMLPQDLLGLLRQWWKLRPRRYDAGVPQTERWLFPGRRLGRPITTRQFNRLFHEAAEAAGITKPVTLHSLRHSPHAELVEPRHPPLGARDRYSPHPGPLGSRQARHGAKRGAQPGAAPGLRQARSPTSRARSICCPSRAEASRRGRKSSRRPNRPRPWVAERWKSRTSSATSASPGVGPTPATSAWRR